MKTLQKQLFDVRLMALDISTHIIEVSGIIISIACGLIYFKRVKTIAY